MEYPFPQPRKIGPASVWRLHDLLAWEARCNGEPMPPAPSPGEERYLSAKKVAERYDRSVPSVWRWAAESRAVA